jgi:staphylococcal nuclease domain-containing protein 1
MAFKGNANIDEPGAFPAREWLCQLVVGKILNFETRKQGALAGDQVYGLLTFTPAGAAKPINNAVEVVKNGNATPKYATQNNASTEDDNEVEEYEYKKNLLKAN